MAYSLILIDLENKLKVDEFSAFLQSNSLGIDEVLYCCTKQQSCEINGFNNIVFQSAENVEKIINTVVKKCKFDNIIVVRNVDEYKKIKNLISKHKKNNQVVYLQKKQTTFNNFLYKIQNIIGKIFAHSIYFMDYGATLYGGVASKVLKSVSSPSVLMRTNRWTGIEMVAALGGEKYKFAYNIKKSMAYTLTPLIVGLIMIVLKIAIRPKMFIALNVMYYGFVALLLLLGAVFGSRWILNAALGENILEKAEILN